MSMNELTVSEISEKLSQLSELMEDPVDENRNTVYAGLNEILDSSWMPDKPDQPKPPAKKRKKSETGAKYISIKEIAKFYRVSEVTVRVWCDAGHLRHEKIPFGTHRRILRSDFEAFKAVNPSLAVEAAEGPPKVSYDKPGVESHAT